MLFIYLFIDKIENKDTCNNSIDLSKTNFLNLTNLCLDKKETFFVCLNETQNINLINKNQYKTEYYYAKNISNLLYNFFNFLFLNKAMILTITTYLIIPVFFIFI